jgi:thioredoxin-related protein
MNTRIWFTTLLLVASALCFAPIAYSADSPTAKKILYDIKADGNDQIKVALEKAQKENKNVILKFGANWCGWCHRLSDTFKENEEIKTLLNENYILVLIDVDKNHNEDIVKRYNNPTQHGLPVLVVLDKTGKQLHTQDTALLEDGSKHDPAKVKAFLTKWKSGNR